MNKLNTERVYVSISRCCPITIDKVESVGLSNISCLNNERRKYIFSRYSLIEISTAVVNLLSLLLLLPYNKLSHHWIFIRINTRQLHIIKFPFVMLVAVVLVVSLFFLSFLLPSYS